MANNRIPNYHFASKDSTGIVDVPVGRMIIIEDYDGKMRAFIKKSNIGLSSLTKISQALNSLESVSTGINIAEVVTQTVGTTDLHRILDTRLF